MVETSPGGAQVEVDGILVQSPAQVAVPVHGDHVLSVRLSGYQPVSQAVRFESGLVQTVFVRLEPVGP